MATERSIVCDALVGCALLLAVCLAAPRAVAQDFPVEPVPVPRDGAAVPDAAPPRSAPGERNPARPRRSAPVVQPAPPAAASPAPTAPADSAPIAQPTTTPAVADAPIVEADARGTDPSTPAAAAPSSAPVQETAAAAGPAGDDAADREDAAVELLGESVAPGQRAVIRWRVGESFDGTVVSTPVTVVHGAKPGPRLCLTAAVHGDELNGVEVVRRVVNELEPRALSGAVIAVPVVNLLGFSRGTRYLPDRRDLNRFFPGTPVGSAASRIAFSLFRDIIAHCDALVDFHTGSFDRSNLPQVRGDLRNPKVLEFTRGFGATPVLHSPGTRGMLRLAASDQSIPSVTFEVGAPLRLEPEKIDFAVQAINALMHHLGMTRSFRMFAEPQATFYESKWVRVDHGGMLFATVALGDRVRAGQRLGKVVDPLLNEEHEIMSPFRGRVIGLALNQVVLPGFAAFHIGIETSEQQAVEEAQHPAVGDDALERMEGDEMGPAPPESAGERSEPDAAAPPDEQNPGS
jgi:predicted deacylase